MKDDILAVLQNKDVNRIRELAAKKKSIMTKLLARTYDHNEEIRWQAVEALAAASSIWVRQDLSFIQNFCRRLVWMLNDESGNMGWFAPQVLGAVIAENPDKLSDFIPLLLSVLDQKNEAAITVGALWAAGRIGPIHEDYTNEALRKIRPYLNSTIPEISEQAQKSYHILATPANIQ